MPRLTTATIDDSIKPAIEWINGKPVQKLMPTDFHAMVSALFWRALFLWSKLDGRSKGFAGVGWRFNVPANAFKTESVVPDVAYLANYFEIPKAQRRYPTVPPDIVVEVRAPDDTTSDVDAKRDFYVWWGVKLIIIADPERRTVETYEADAISYFTERDTVTSEAFPTLSIPLHDLFAELDEPES